MRKEDDEHGKWFEWLTRPRGPILGANDEPPGASPPVTRTMTRHEKY